MQKSKGDFDMKRFSVIIAAVILCVVLAACGSDNSPNGAGLTPEAPDNAVTEAATEAEAQLPTGLTVDEYIVMLKKDIESKGGMSDDYTIGKVYTDDKGIVYDYTLRKQNAGQDLESVTQAVEQLFGENDAMYKEALNELQTSTGQKLQVKVVYHNADGSVIMDKIYE